MKVDKKLALVAVAAFALAWFVSHTDDGFIPNPFVPQRPDRPVLKFLVRVAKTALWVVAFAEPKPTYPQSHHLVQSNVGPDGHECLNHAEGF